MKLYHYSTSPYNELLTKRKQGGLTPDQIKRSVDHANLIHDPGPYIDHISLFFDPIPLERIAKIFGNRHDFWKTGQGVYVHVIDTASLPRDLLWSIVETPEIDNYTDQFDWTITDKAVRTKYLQDMNDEMVRLKLVGRTTKGLVEAVKPYLGKTEQAYIDARKRSDAEDTLKQYAANVPHLMVYPATGKIKVESYQLDIVGKPQHRNR